ncbi:MAG: hypothetical protein K1X29_02855 [Bdellovibrionales bacterium]|nr:hypothetical protein [Bdellovibrionales bacterium]
MLLKLKFQQNLLITIISFLSVFSSSIFAETLGDSDLHTQTYTSSSYMQPKCIENANEVQKIKSWVRENTKNENKYEEYKNALQKENRVLTMARLIYAETLAANCDGTEIDKAQKLIASTIHNRVINQNTDYTSGVDKTVFTRDQFASSLNFYKESKNESFLCPKLASNIWMTSLNYAKQSKEKFNTKSPLFQESDGKDNHYYLNKHFKSRSSQPPKPNWTKKPQSAISKRNENSCVTSYSL